MRIPRALLAVLVFGTTAPAAGAAPALVIRVEPRAGHDVAPGAAAPTHPVATIGNALALAAALHARDPARALVVQLPGGLTRLSAPLVIGADAGGTAAAPLEIRGAPDGSTVLSGSVQLAPADLPLPARVAARLPAEARTHVRLYRLPERALASPTALALSLLRDRPSGPPIEVYDGTGALAPAHWPREGWGAIEGPSRSGQAGFRVEKGDVARWRGEPDLWAEGFWRFDWLWEAVPLSGLEPAPGVLGFRTLPDEGVIKPGARVRIVHALADLDQPGEWWRDRADGLLVAWPRDLPGLLELAATDVLIRVERGAHLRLDHLTLEHARQQAVLVHDSDDVVLRHVTVRWVGGDGVVFDHATRSGLEDCTIEAVGAAGAKLLGGDRPTLTPGGLFVRHSLFTGFGRLILTQQPGIAIDGVGVTLDGNLIRDAGAPGIGIRGNEHRITGNELTGLLAGVTDNGAIYAGRDWTARGTLIAGNYLHDIRADPGFENKGVYLDDEASGFAIRGNLFVRVDQPVFIGGGRDNVVENNLFVASSPAMHVDSRGQTWAGKAMSDPASDLRLAYAAMPVASPLWRARYPGLATILADEPAVGKNNRLVGNTVVDGTPFDFADGGEAARQVIHDNRGPGGLRLPGADLDALAKTGRDPRAFRGLVDAQGRTVPLDLDGMLRPGPR